MSAIFIAFGGMIIFYLGYRFYSKFVAEKIFKLDPNYVTPAHKYNDGVDFVPTNKHVLWGHHFTSVAGAAPILGPAIAVFWGWLPALLWVLLGTVFAAGVHDFGTIVISNRHKGQSMGTLTTRIMGKRAKTLFLLVILFLVLMVNAVFAWVIANLFIKFPGSVIPIFIEIPIAIAIGYWVYKRKGGLLIPSLIALVLLYVFIYVGYKVPVDTVAILGENTNMAFVFWILILMIYSLIASTLPVWTLLQPRDYINSHQLFVALGILYLGLIIVNPEVTAPMFNDQMPAGSPNIFPLLFITIACGAISGFHGLVSSGTTSKQLDKETDARYVGYFGAVGEGALALIAIIAVAAGFALTTADWQTAYATFGDANKGALGNFIVGAANLASGIGIPVAIGQVFVSVIVISFAATTLDTSVRLLRYIIAEIGHDYHIKPLQNGNVAAFVGVALSTWMIFSTDGGNGIGSGGYVFWPLFGTTNQLLAGLSLLVISIWLYKTKRNPLPTLVPMIFIFAMTLWAMVLSVLDWIKQDKILLYSLGSLIFVLAIWMILEAFNAFSRKNPIQDDHTIAS